MSKSLQLLYPDSVTPVWDPVAGTLNLSGGAVVTPPSPNPTPSPVPAGGPPQTFPDQLSMINWQSVNSGFPNTLMVGGVRVGYPGSWPAYNYTVQGGQLVFAGLIQNPTPAPAPAPSPTPTPTPGTQPGPGDRVHTVVVPVSGQIKPTLDAEGNTQFILIPVPVYPWSVTYYDAALRRNVSRTITPMAGRMGFIRVTEEPGQDFVARDMIVWNSAGQELYRYNGSGNTSPDINWAVDNPTGFRRLGAAFNVQGGDTLRVSISNPNWGPGVRSRMYVDIAYPHRGA